MTERKVYTMTQAQYDAILEAIQPQPYIVVGGVAPLSQQERANNAWKKLGQEMGFKGMTVRPYGAANPLMFTAEPIEEGELP